MGEKQIRLSYYAVLREQRGLGSESLGTTASTARELWSELREMHDFKLDLPLLRVVINEVFTDWDAPLHDGDHVVFIPPVAGG